MAFLILPSRRTRQPQGAACVDWSNPLARELRAAILPHLGIDLVTGRLQQSGQTNNGPMPYGMARKFAAGGASYGHHSNYALTTSGTIVGLYRTSLSDYGGMIAAKQQSTIQYANYGFYGAYGAEEKLFFSFASAGAVRSEWVTTNTVPTLYTTGGLAAISWGGTGSTDIACYFNGVDQPLTLVKYETHYGDDSGSSELRIGDRYDGVVKQTGEHGLLLLWNRKLSAQEHVALAQNPWQLFSPDPRRIYFAPSGGGTTGSNISFDLPRPKGSMRPTVMV